MGAVENRGRKPRFSTTPKGSANVTAYKIMFVRYYCMKSENVCYILHYFLYYFVSPFHQCLAKAISTDYARSRAVHYTSRDGTNSVAPVKAY